MLKDSSKEELIQAIRLVSRGLVFASSAVKETFEAALAGRKNASGAQDRFESLTDRQRQVYQLVAEGNSNKEIALRLTLSPHTVETHRWNIMEKLDLHTTAALVLDASRRGIVTKLA